MITDHCITLFGVKMKSKTIAAARFAEIQTPFQHSSGLSVSKENDKVCSEITTWEQDHHERKGACELALLLENPAKNKKTASSSTLILCSCSYDLA